jgi:hypothetical protein
MPLESFAYHIGKQAAITLDIEVGDTLLFGRYKNSPKVVKEIGTDDKGQPTINGMKLLACRIKKKMPGEKEAEALGPCLREALAAIEKDKAMRLMMGNPGRPEDTAHFWAEREGKVVDNSGTVPAEYKYEGREVDPDDVLAELENAT